MNNKQIELKFEEEIDINTVLAKSIYDILVSCDNEFVPPLSTRNATTQTDFNSIVSCEIPYQYWINILKQKNILAYVDDCLAGFMSFKCNYDIGNWFNVKIGKNIINNYISTVCIYKDYRRLGLAKKMYNYIENNLPNKYRSSKDWCTLAQIIKLLYKTVILLPGFDYSDIKGVVNTNTINIKLDEDERTLKDRLSQFYESIILEFGLQKLTSSKWEQYRDDFIGRVNQGK